MHSHGTLRDGHFEITSPDFGRSRLLLNILLHTSSVVSKANQTIKTLQSCMSYCTVYLLVDTTVGLGPSSSRFILLHFPIGNHYICTFCCKVLQRLQEPLLPYSYSLQGTGRISSEVVIVDLERNGCKDCNYQSARHRIAHYFCCTVSLRLRCPMILLYGYETLIMVLLFCRGVYFTTSCD
jgi:hypothetical protein